MSVQHLCLLVSFSLQTSILALGTNVADSLRYARVGVRMSAGMVAHIGTMLGGLGESFKDARTRWIVSKDGCIFS